MTRRIVMCTLIAATALVRSRRRLGRVQWPTALKAVPVLVTAGLASHEAVFNQVLAADEAADGRGAH